jgi:hypothetical protein
MTAKSFFRAIPFAALMVVSLPAICSTFPADSAVTIPATNTSDSRSQQLVNRLEEIKDMDKARMTKTEKQQLRKEVKNIRSEMRQHSHLKTYLYIGAVLIAILLIILLI